MKFFIPLVENGAEAQSAYAALKQCAAGSEAERLSERKIHCLQYRHNGKQYCARVGKAHAANREIVLAILYDPRRDLYLVCTPTRGAWSGSPLLVGGSSVTAVVEFDP